MSRSDDRAMTRVPLGRVVATHGVMDAVQETGARPLVPLLERHARGDWGEVNPHDQQANDEALEHGDRLLSAYTLRDGTRIWILTEWDRSVTTILLPSEY